MSFQRPRIAQNSKGGSEAAWKGLAYPHLKPILSKSQYTGMNKSIINEIPFE